MNTITTAALALCDELREEITRLEYNAETDRIRMSDMVRENDALLDRNNEMSDRMVRAERDNDTLRATHYTTSNYKVHALERQQHMLLQLLQHPTLAATIVAYMNGEGAKLHTGDKIAVIKGVRELTRDSVVGLWCLKDSKDFVESYIYPPKLTSMQPEGPMGDMKPVVADPNPCRDTSCLNGAD